MMLFKVSPTDLTVFIFLIPSVTVIITSTIAAPADEPHFCSNATTFSQNSTYQTNRNQLLSWLSSNSTRQNGFYYTTAGSGDNTVYGAFLCRGDLAGTDACQECASAVAESVLQNCPKEKESVIWDVDCMLRYSNQSFFSTTGQQPMMILVNTGSLSGQIDRFMTLLGETLNAAVEQAANGGGEKKFGTREANFSSFQTVYTLAQCTPDLTEAGCEECLKGGISRLPSCCNGNLGARVLFSSCNIRYELYPYYHLSPAVSPLTEPTSKVYAGKTRVSVAIVIAIVAPIVLALLLVFLACWFITRRASKNNSEPEENVENFSVEYLQFDLEIIKLATNNFSDDNKLGEGGFGEVFKGTLLNGQDIAVKRLSKNSMQGTEEFKNEMVLVAKLQHKNLVRLLGFCLDGEEKILIYEFVANKSLDHFLFNTERQHQLDWPRRYKIIEGIARGMLYLHEDSRLKIIHRDLKASNILLDEDLNPKIADFGMARIFGADQTQGNTSRVVGTLGYMPSEYAMHGQYSVKMDVYSFGVLILEIISGKKNTSFRESDYAEDLLSYAWKKWRDGTPLELLDVSLRDSCRRDEVSRCIHIGLSCVQEDPAQRPTMQTIVLMLNSHSVTLASPERPPFLVNSNTIEPSLQLVVSSDESNIRKPVSDHSIDDASITQVYPR